MKDLITRLDRLDAYVAEMLEPWKAVGLVVGVVKDGEVIFEGAYGDSHYQQKPLTKDTLFAIGSASKAFTSTAIGVLIGQDKIKSWDDKVIEYLPYYRASDEYAQNNMTIKDLLTMRSGYSRKGWDNMLFHGSHYTMEQIIEKSRYIPFDLQFRDRMRYDNLNYMLVGKIIEEVSQGSWHDFIYENILKTLCMHSSGSSYQFALQSADMAAPHLFYDGTYHQIALRNIDNAAPAGSIVSNCSDMLRWAAFQLSRQGDCLISEKDLRKTQTPHTVIDRELFRSEVLDDSAVVAYGMGWFIYDLGGVRCVGHGGHIDGFSSFVHLVPEQNAGVVVLNNSDHNDVSQPIIRTATDILCNRAAKYDYNDVFLSQYRKGHEEYKQNMTNLLAKLRGKPADLNLAEYCGRYVSPIFGTQAVELEEGQLKVERFDWRGTLHYLEKDTFVALWDDDMTHPPLKFEFCKSDGGCNKVQVEMFDTFIRE